MSDSRQKKSVNPVRLFLYIPVPWVFILGYLAGLMPQYFYPVMVHSHDTLITIKIAGAILFTIGASFAGWSLIIFNRAHTTTTPGEKSRVLVTTGPYRISRNPMYVSLTLAYLGEAGMLVQVWPLLTLLLVLAYINRVVIPLEEGILREDFKGEYIKYTESVRRWL